MITSLFVNLSIKDKDASKAFFTALGMSFNATFESENSCCLIINQNIFAMLLEENRFKDFTDKQICNTTTTTEVLLALQVESKQEVDEMMKKVVKAGGKDAQRVEEFEYMYSRSFEDIDGHIWELFWMQKSESI